MRCLTLFAGAGGADVGLADAGIEHALSVEWDEDAAATSRAAGFPCVTGDVRDLTLCEGVDDIDLLWSSFPCQDFSTAGKRAGAKGDRNGWPWTIDVLEHLRAQGNPVPWLIAENVRGLTMHLGDCPTRTGEAQTDLEACPRCYLDGVIMVELLERFAWAEWRILDAADYGVPQRRRRIIIVAGPRAIEWPEPTHSGEALAAAKWVSGSYWQEFAGAEPIGTPSAQEARWLVEHRQQGLFGAPPRFKLKPWRTVRQALGLGGTISSGDPRHALEKRNQRPWPTDEPCLPVTTKGNQYLSMVMEIESGNKSNVARGHGIKPIDGPSDAIQTEGGAMLRRGDTRRRLTVRECATLQDFPQGYPWQGNKTAQYRQVGNAVPPRLAQVVAQAVIKADKETR